MRVQLLKKSVSAIFKNSLFGSEWRGKAARLSGQSLRKKGLILIRGPAHCPVISAQLKCFSFSSSQHRKAVLSVGRCHGVFEALFNNFLCPLPLSSLCLFNLPLFIEWKVFFTTTGCGLMVLLSNNHHFLG